MNIQDIYNQSKNNFLFSDSEKFTVLRKNIINNFDLSSKVRKNNESLKHLDPNVLEFLYKYKNTSNNIYFTNNNESNINLDVCNGKISKVQINKEIDHINITLGKAGRSRWLGKKPKVRGVVKNPIDHPHGGGEGRSPIGRTKPVTPWGKPALGIKTRNKNKASSKLILRSRR